MAKFLAYSVNIEKVLYYYILSERKKWISWMIKFPDMNVEKRNTRISFSYQTKLSWSKHVKKT